MNKRWDIFGIGTAAVDDLVYVEHFPTADTKQPAQSIQRHGGGQTATALVAAARQGARTAFCCRLGADELSRFTVQTLEAEGVDCSPVIACPACGPVHSVIIVDSGTGSRTILYDSSAAREPNPDEIDPAWIAASRLVFFDQNAPRAGLHAARLARTLGIPVAADLEKRNLPEMDAILAHIDHLIVSQDFARALTGLVDPAQAARALAVPPRAATVVTCGGQGCWYAEGSGEPRHFPAYSVPVVDTTGCGDVFHGAYAAAITRGEPIPRAIQTASATAALKAMKPGGRAGIPGLEEIRKLGD